MEFLPHWGGFRPMELILIIQLKYISRRFFHISSTSTKSQSYNLICLITNHHIIMATKITWASINSKPNAVLSPGFVHGSVFSSGTVGSISEQDGKVPESIEEQVHQTLKNLQTVLKEGGASIERVFKVNAYLSHSQYKKAFNEIYAQYFKNKPARTCVVVQFMDPSIKVEVEAIATLDSDEEAVKIPWASIPGKEHPTLSPGFVNKNFVYSSGIIGSNYATGETPESVEEQIHLAIKNLEKILKEGGSSLENVFKVNVFLSHGNYAKVTNEIYSQYFKQKPARTCVIAEFMDVPIKFELEAIATVNEAPAAKKITWESIQGKEHPVLSPAYISSDSIFTSGTVGQDYSTGKIPDSIEDQVHLAIKNLETVLKESGSSLEKVFKANVFISHADYIGVVNKIYGEYFKQKPARTCVIAAFMDSKVKFELEAIATR